MSWWYASWLGGWGVMWLIGVVLFWLLVVTGVIALIRYTARSGHAYRNGVTRRPPEQVLAERFAHGEIDEDEYRRRLEILRTSGWAST